MRPRIGCLENYLIMRLIPVLCLAAAVGTIHRATAEDYPTRPIRIITAEYGGGTDFITRLLAQAISPPLGQGVIVENRGSALTADLVTKAQPNGYTLGIGGATIWLSTIMRKTSYQLDKDVAWISMVARQPLAVVVHPSVPAKSIQELIALAKAKPGVLNYGSSAAGTSNHVAGELLKSMAGVDIVRVVYKGGGPALSALLAGEVQVAFPSAGAVAPHIKSGKLKALAVTSLQPSALAPGLPTVAASGFPGYEAGSNLVMFAPGKTPSGVLRTLSREVTRGLSMPDVSQKVLAVGSEVAPSSPQEVAAFVKADINRMGKLLKAADITIE